MIKPQLSGRFLVTLNAVATDARWWAGGFFVVLEVIATSSFVADKLTTGSSIIIGAAALILALAIILTTRNVATVAQPQFMSESIGVALGQKIENLEMKLGSDRQQNRMQQEMLVDALRARDAEGIIKTADMIVLSLSAKLLEASSFYNDAEWSDTYQIWEEAMTKIDRTCSAWERDHAPFFNDRLRDIDQSAPLPPSNIKESTVIAHLG
jgi:hypothetical protein